MARIFVSGSLRGAERITAEAVNGIGWETRGATAAIMRGVVPNGSAGSRREPPGAIGLEARPISKSPTGGRSSVSAAGQPTVSVVIPVYCSEDCVGELLCRLTSVLESRGDSHEILLVEDASPDGTWTRIRELLPEYPNASAVRLMRNHGQHRATLCGLERARGRLVVTMDDDLQHAPEQLPPLLDALEQQPELDCVFGVYRRKLHARYRNLGSRILSWVNARAFGLPKGVTTSSFRAMRREVAESVVRHRSANPAISALVHASTRRIASIPVDHAPRFAGRSTYTLGKQISLALDNVCNVSLMPLRLVSVMGIGICMLTMIYVAFILVQYWRGRVGGVAGWTSLVILISFFAGVILLSIGVIGEYMVRILREVQGAPLYLVREELGPPKRAREDDPGSFRASG